MIFSYINKTIVLVLLICYYYRSKEKSKKVCVFMQHYLDLTKIDFYIIEGAQKWKIYCYR